MNGDREGLPDTFRLPRVSGLIDRRLFLPERARGRAVLHLGCVDEHLTATRAGSGALLHEELSKVARRVVGVDLSDSGLAELEAFVPGVYVRGDVEQLDKLALPGDCDLVLAPELIEHLPAPGRFLSALRAHLEQTGATAWVTTPNAYSWTHWLHLALRRTERTHPDHVCLYSPTTLVRALQLAGLEPSAFYIHRWERSATLRDRLLAAVDAAILRWNPWLGVGLVVEVRPRQAEATTR